MLVFTRRKDESIQIGDSISVTVVEVRPGKVRLAIDAPDGVRVDRHEVRRRIEVDNAKPSGDESAASTGSLDPGY